MCFVLTYPPPHRLQVQEEAEVAIVQEVSGAEVRDRALAAAKAGGNYVDLESEGEGEECDLELCPSSEDGSDGESEHCTPTKRLRSGVMLTYGPCH